MSAETFVVLEHRVRSEQGGEISIDARSTQILGVFGTAAEAIRWVLKAFEETAGARRQLSDAEKLALFNLLVAADPFIENTYTPPFIPLMQGKVMQVLGGRMLGSLVTQMKA